MKTFEEQELVDKMQQYLKTLDNKKPVPCSEYYGIPHETEMLNAKIVLEAFLTYLTYRPYKL